MFRINITHLISDRLINKHNPKEGEVIKVEKNEKYCSVIDLINKVEINTNGTEYELDIFEIIEQLLSSLEFVNSSLGVMTTSVDDFSIKMRNRTTELEKINIIKDNRLRLNKIQIVVNLFAAELDEFSYRINQELPRFSVNFLGVGPLYSKIVQYAANHYIVENTAVKKALLTFRDSVEVATSSSASMLEQILKWPPMTSRFNKSKRATELVIKNLVSELLQGLKLLDEALI